MSDPSNPVDKGYAEGTGYQPVLQDSGKYMLISTDDYNHGNTIVHAFDVSTGTPSLAKVANLTGRMHDQFKMAVVGHALVAVSEVAANWVWGPSTSTHVGNLVTVNYSYTVYPAHTWVETFSLDDTGSTALARLHLDDAEGENLYAARFDGQRLYVVTYGVRQKGPQAFNGSYSYSIHRPCDPLYIIDLTDPSKPQVRGQLEIPGYSSFIECLGDRLLSVGREDSRLAASLFDVSDIDNPALLSRVYPGADDGWWASSEAETEHRAVTWLRDQKKFIVPYTVWGSSGLKSTTQEVRYTHSTLTLGDKVVVDGAVRRGTSINGCLLSISGRELVVCEDSAKGSADASEVASLLLAWPVDRIAAVGDYLLEVESFGEAPYECYPGCWSWPYVSVNSNNCRAGQHGVLRLARRSDPETILDTAELDGTSTSIVGLTARDGLVYLAQAVPVENGQTTAELRTYVIKPSGGKIQQVASGSCTISLSQVSQTAHILFDHLQPLWVADKQLVWFIPCNQKVDDYYYKYPWCYCPDDPSKPSDEEIARRHRVSAGWGNAVTALLCPVTVGSRSISVPPAPICVLAAPIEARLYTTSRAFVDGGRVFFSSTQEVDRQQSETTPEMTLPDSFWHPAEGATMYTSLLHEVNFSEPVVQSELRTTALPGTLVGVSAADSQGAWLMCFREWLPDNNYSAESLGLFSLAFDGVSVDVSLYWQNQKSGRLLNLGSGHVGSGMSASLQFVGKHLIAASWQSLAVARVNDDRTLTTLGTKQWDGYTCVLKSSRAVLDPKGEGAWVPAADYGTEWLQFDNAEPLALMRGD